LGLSLSFFFLSINQGLAEILVCDLHHIDLKGLLNDLPSENRELLLIIGDILMQHVFVIEKHLYHALLLGFLIRLDHQLCVLFSLLARIKHHLHDVDLLFAEDDLEFLVNFEKHHFDV